MVFLILFLKYESVNVLFFFFQAEDGIRDADVTGVQTCALPISRWRPFTPMPAPHYTSGRVTLDLRRTRACASTHRSSNRMATAVMLVMPRVSNGGETSTRSAPTKLRLPSSRIRRWASIVV